MKFLNKFKESGMTMVEVMVAGGLMAGLSVAGMALFKNQSTAQKTVEQNYEVTNAVGAIRSLLADPSSCMRNLGSLNPDGNTNILTAGIMRVRNGADVTPAVYIPGGMIPGTSLKVNTFKLRRTGYTNLGGNETMLEISFSRGMQGKQVFKDELTRTVKIVYQGTTAITPSCYADTSTRSDSLWQISANGTDIYYMTGNAAIGMATAATKLQIRHEQAISYPTIGNGVYGALNFDMTTSGTSTGISWNGTTTYGPQAGIYVYQHNSPGTTMHFATTDTYATGQQTRMTILNNGYVGVGTVAPTAKFEIMATSGADANNPHLWVSSTSAAHGRLGLGVQATHAFIQSHNSLPLKINELSNNTIINQNAGNVGIGIANPTTKLHLQGLSTVASFDSTSSYSDLRFCNTVGGCGGYVGYYDTNIRLYANSGSVPTVTVSGAVGAVPGNLGVGTTTPDFKIEAVGNIKSARAEVGDQTGITIGATAQEQPKIEFNMSDNSRRFWLQTNGVNTAAERLTLYGGPLNGNATNELMTFAGNQRIGINTSSPQFTLDVNGDSMRLGNDTALVRSDLYISSTQFSDLWFCVAGSCSGQIETTGTYMKINSLGRPLQLHTNNTVRMSIDLSGNTTFSGTVTANSYTYSDARLKEKVSTIENPLEKIRQLRGVRFTWKKEKNRDMGFIAQELEKVEPDLVRTDSDGIKSVKYTQIVALIVEAIKEILLGQDELKSDFEDLKKENEELKKRLDQQDKMIRELASRKG